MKILQLLPIYGSKQREAQPYKFERDKPLPNYNEVHAALAKWRQDIDNAKREGKI